jgi:DNA-binding transcriptional regulator YdaS (Cro superfamily)
MSTVEARLIEAAGGPAAVASLVRRSVQAACFWRDGKRQLPVEFIPVLEAAAGNRVRRWELRPDDWHRIWPELIGADGAPEVPKAEEARDAA